MLYLIPMYLSQSPRRFDEKEFTAVVAQCTTLEQAQQI